MGHQSLPGPQTVYLNYRSTFSSYKHVSKMEPQYVTGECFKDGTSVCSKQIHLQKIHITSMLHNFKAFFLSYQVHMHNKGKTQEQIHKPLPLQIIFKRIWLKRIQQAGPFILTALKNCAERGTAMLHQTFLHILSTGKSKSVTIIIKWNKKKIRKEWMKGKW